MLFVEGYALPCLLMALENEQNRVRALDLPAGGILAKRRPVCVDWDYEKTACE